MEKSEKERKKREKLIIIQNKVFLILSSLMESTSFFFFLRLSLSYLFFSFIPTVHLSAYGSQLILPLLAYTVAKSVEMIK